jgi:hypothetical protein
VLAGGGRVGVVRDADEMLGLLDAWCIPRARRLVFECSMARAPSGKGEPASEQIGADVFV